MQNSGSKKSFKAGEIIMKQGDAGDSAYIIEDGRVDIFIEKEDGKAIAVGSRGSGAMIGEMALVDNAPRTATIKASEDVTVYEISKEDFVHRLDNADPILKMTTQVILTRYRDTLTRAEIAGEQKAWPGAEAIELEYADQSAAVENIKMSNEFKSALEDGDTTLFYQPIIDLQSGLVSGFEALMRWEHEERGFISPGVFIPLAEESGLILKASQWALKEACAALQRVEQRTGSDDDLFMSVNFSSRDFASDDFVGSVYDTISRTDLKPSQIHIEITERMLMDQPDSAGETLRMCRDAGMSIAIDDFGTGYSSLSYLHYFPIDTLKIDRSFIMDMHKDEASMNLVKSIVALGKNMKMKIIAEGVESQEEAQSLRDLGCEMAQGFYFSRPLSENDATRFTAETKKMEF